MQLPRRNDTGIEKKKEKDKLPTTKSAHSYTVAEIFDREDLKF